MKVYGDEEQLEEFDKRMEMLLTHFSRYNAIDENVIERLLMTDGASDYKSEKIDDVLVARIAVRFMRASHCA